MSWYVLYVETGQEDLVRAMICKFYEASSMYAIVPKRKLQERRQGRTYEVCQTIFPGYIFVNTEMNAKTYNELRQLPKCYRLLNNYNNRDRKLKHGKATEAETVSVEPYLFSKVDDIEMKPILRLIGRDEVIGYSSLYLKDARAVVCDGPLTGEEERIRKIDARKKRARIVLKLNGVEKYLDVGINILSAPERVSLEKPKKSE